MSRSTVFQSTANIVESIKQPALREAWVKFKSLMKYSEIFEHICDLVPPTLLSQQSGSYLFKIELTVDEADLVGTGYENLGNNQVHYDFRILIRSFKLEHDGELKIDTFPPSALRVNEVFIEYKDGPVDITKHVKVCPNVTNTVNVDVSSTSGFYVLTIILVKAFGASTIAKRLSESRLRPAEITQEKILRFHDMTNPDVAVTSTKFSLVCPLSQKRFQIPAQGDQCNHLSCFDLETYLIVSAQSQKWLCPICHKPLLLANLIVDGYWKEIVDKFNKEKNNSCSVLMRDGGVMFP